MSLSLVVLSLFLVSTSLAEDAQLRARAFEMVEHSRSVQRQSELARDKSCGALPGTLGVIVLLIREAVRCARKA